MKSPIKRASLETSTDIENTLTWKMKAIEEEYGDIEVRLADYIAGSIARLDGDLEYINQSQKVIAEKKKYIESQIKLIKQDGAKFFLSAGIEKLKGIQCSSVTLTKEKPSETTEEDVEVFVPLISQAEIEELLISLGKAKMEKRTISKTSNYIPAALKVNMPKVVKAEMIEE